MNPLINKVVHDFYALATTDIIIGYHFRKIQTQEGSHPLKPPLEAFSHHLPRIVHFWEVQLLGETLKGQRFDLIEVHRALGILPGELGRWLTLFRQVLAKENQEDEFIKKWREKLDHFEKIFQKQLF
jgi:truncated hemoglobin YjbI